MTQSSCCKAPLISVTSGEGTGYYKCEACEKPCDECVEAYVCQECGQTIKANGVSFPHVGCILQKKEKWWNSKDFEDGDAQHCDCDFECCNRNIEKILSAHTQRMIEKVEGMKRDYNLDALDAVIEMLKKET